MAMQYIGILAINSDSQQKPLRLIQTILFPYQTNMDRFFVISISQSNQLLFHSFFFQYA